MTNTVPLYVAEHLSMSQKLPEVNMKHVAIMGQHYVVIMSISNTKTIGGDTVAGTGQRKVLNSLSKSNHTENLKMLNRNPG